MNTRRNTATIVIVVSVLFLAGVFLYREFLTPGGGYGYGYGYGGHMMTGIGGWGIGGLMLVFWSLILFGLILMINWLLTANRNEKNGGSGSDPIEILKRRYAAGEIDRNRYEQMRRELLQ